jgi:hypothetical protein
MEEKGTDVVTALLGRQANIRLADARRYVEYVERILWSDNPPKVEDVSILPWCQGGVAQFLPFASRCYQLLGHKVICRFADQVSLNRVGALFAHLEQHNWSDSQSALEICSIGDNIEIRQGSRVLKVADPASLANAMRLVIADICLSFSPDEWAVHAAAVQHGGRAVLMPGPTGCGKSTLVLGLSAAGATLLGDDTVAMASGTLDIRAMPFPICIKQGAWNIVDALLDHSGRVEEGRRYDGVAVRWLSPSAGVRLAKADARATAEHIVFPRYLPDYPTRLSTLDTDDALCRLIPALHALGEGLTPSKVERLIAWTGRLSCFELRFSELDEGVEAVWRLLS